MTRAVGGLCVHVPVGRVFRWQPRIMTQPHGPAGQARKRRSALRGGSMHGSFSHAAEVIMCTAGGRLRPARCSSSTTSPKPAEPDARQHLPGRHPVLVAPDGVDPAVVGDQPAPAWQLPRRERVRREARVDRDGRRCGAVVPRSACLRPRKTTRSRTRPDSTRAASAGARQRPRRRVRPGGARQSVEPCDGGEQLRFGRRTGCASAVRQPPGRRNRQDEHAQTGCRAPSRKRGSDRPSRLLDGVFHGHLSWPLKCRFMSKRGGTTPALTMTVIKAVTCTFRPGRRAGTRERLPWTEAMIHLSLLAAGLVCRAERPRAAIPGSLAFLPRFDECAQFTRGQGTSRAVASGSAGCRASVAPYDRDNSHRL